MAVNSKSTKFCIPHLSLTASKEDWAEQGMAPIGKFKNGKKGRLAKTVVAIVARVGVRGREIRWGFASDEKSKGLVIEWCVFEDFRMALSKMRVNRFPRSLPPEMASKLLTPEDAWSPDGPTIWEAETNEAGQSIWKYNKVSAVWMPDPEACAGLVYVDVVHQPKSPSTVLPISPLNGADGRSKKRKVLESTEPANDERKAAKVSQHKQSDVGSPEYVTIDSDDDAGETTSLMRQK